MLAGEPDMKKLSTLVPAAAAVVLLSAMVLAAPESATTNPAVAGAPDRAAAFMIASAN